MTKVDEARYCILQNAFMSTGATCVFKALVPIPWLEIGALTWVAKNMCDRVTEIYGYEDLPGMPRFFGTVIEAATRAKLASGIFDVVPGFNIGTNAIATFTLHAVTGIIVISACKLLDEETIRQKEIENTTSITIDRILNTVTAVVGMFARGNYTEAIQIVMEAFRESLIEDNYLLDDESMDVIEAEVTPLILLAAAEATKEIAEDIGLLTTRTDKEDQTEEKENIEDAMTAVSVADVLDYNDFVKQVYDIHLGVLQPHQSMQEIIAAAGQAYQTIYDRNCREGLWSLERGFDDTLAYYVACHTKKTTNCDCLCSYSQEDIAAVLSRYMQHGIVSLMH